MEQAVVVSQLSEVFKDSLAQMKSGYEEGRKADKDFFDSRIAQLESQVKSYEDADRQLATIRYEDPVAKALAPHMDAIRNLSKNRGTIQFNIEPPLSGRDAVTNVKGLTNGVLHQKTTVTNTALGVGTAGILMPERVFGIVGNASRRFTVRDAVPAFPITSHQVYYVKENAFTNNAAPVAETAAKPESALTFTVATATARTIAHLLPFSRQALADSGQDIQSFINFRMRYGLALVEETQLLDGDGTGQNLTGFVTGATAYDTNLNAAGDTALDKVRHAIYQIENTELGYPSVVFVSPKKMHDVDLIKDAASNVGNYVVGDPVSGTRVRTLWGVPVIATKALSTDAFLMLDNQFCAIFDREGVSVEISTDYDDYFAKNMVMMRVESRLTSTITRSTALVTGSL